MTRSILHRLAGLTTSGCFAALLLTAVWGPAAQAQTSTDPASTGPSQTETPSSGSESSPTQPSTNPPANTIPPEDTSTGDTGSSDTTTADTTPRFTCQENNGKYTVMYSPKSQPGQSYPWAIPQDMGSAWPAQRRCAEISARLESYRPDGLKVLQTAVENGYNTVCVTTETDPSCRIVFTVPQGQDPIKTRDQVFANLTSADQGTQTQGVNTFTDGGSGIGGTLGEILNSTLGQPARTSAGGINLRPFLDPADGGTGTQLTGGTSSGRSLNPNNFR